MEIVPLHWDSDFFGLRIAKAVIASEEDIVALSRQEGELRNHFDYGESERMLCRWLG